MAIDIKLDRDPDYERLSKIYSKVLKTRYSGTVNDYRFTYIMNDKYRYIEWKDKSIVPNWLKKRALRKVRNLVNAIENKESL